MLTDMHIRNLKFEGKERKVFIGFEGLYVHLTAKSKFFRIAYRYAGKPTVYTIGKYGVVTLADAKEKTIEIKRQLAEGLNPNTEKKLAKLLIKEETSNTFKVLAMDWLKRTEAERSKDYNAKILKALNADILPYAGDLPLKKLTAEIWASIFKKREERLGNVDFTRVLLSVCERIYADAMPDKIGENHISAIKAKFAVRKPKKHYAYLDKETDLSAFMKALKGFYFEDVTTKLAVEFLLLTFVRNTELRLAKWQEIDLTAKAWIIPAERMKNAKAHIVPLSRQALSILAELKALNRNSDYLFASAKGKARYAEFLGRAVKQIASHAGLNPENVTVHGFRHTASTMLNSMGFNSDWIEKQLAHKEQGMKAVYNHSDFLDQRKEMLQAWADYLDSLV